MSDNDKVYKLIRAMRPIAREHGFALFYDKDPEGGKGWLVQAVDISKADPSLSFDYDMLVVTEKNRNNPQPLGIGKVSHE